MGDGPMIFSGGFCQCPQETLKKKLPAFSKCTANSSGAIFCSRQMDTHCFDLCLKGQGKAGADYHLKFVDLRQKPGGAGIRNYCQCPETIPYSHLNNLCDFKDIHSRGFEEYYFCSNQPKQECDGYCERGRLSHPDTTVVRVNIGPSTFCRCQK